MFLVDKAKILVGTSPRSKLGISPVITPSNLKINLKSLKINFNQTS